MYDPSRFEPRRPVREPIFRVPPATLILAALLVGIFLVTHLLLSTEQENAIFGRFGFLPLAFLAWLDGEDAAEQALLPLVTHQFLHFDALHITLNVGVLLAVASAVERRVGWLAFVAIFLVCGIAGALAQTWLVIDPAVSRNAVLIGASGSIFGLTAVALLVQPPTARQFALTRMIVALMAVNVAIGLASEAGLFGEYLIGWQAHAGGFLMGLLIGWPLRRRLQRHP